MAIDALKQLYDDFMNIINTCVIKYKYEAEKYDTLETKQAADTYMRAYLQEDNFNTYLRYDKTILSEVMNITDPDEIEVYYLDRTKIPVAYRSTLLTRMRNKIITEYVEKNNYYLKLAGKPDYGTDESEYLYCPEETGEFYGIPTDIPLHELDEDYITILQSLGYIDELIAKYPDREYLKYLGNRSIDIITARRGRNFTVLNVPINVSETLRAEFPSMYESCRQYFMACIYTPEHQQTIGHYDHFIAMCIMIMTMQQIFMRSPLKSIGRDFFDDQGIRDLFEIYGLPYHENMDSTTRSQIVHNLNLLIQNKGTYNVIYDIASILGFNRLNIYKYYLMKIQKFTKSGAPVIATKTDPITGEEVPDYEAMFDVYFQKVSMGDIDTYQSLIDPSMNVPYEELTESDPYWLDDEALEEELYASEYNYVETKYMGVSITYRMTKILFENIYLLKLLFEKKDEIFPIRLELPRINPYQSISLFDCIVLLCAMICKQNHLKGEILTSMSKIMHIVGFNLENDFATIKENILNDPNLDNDLVNYFKTSSTRTADQLNMLYENYQNLYSVISEKLATTQDIDVYQSYYKFYKSIFYTDENQTMFNIGTDEEPVYAQTYLEYLERVHPDLAEFVETVETERMYVYVNHICSRIQTIIPNLNYLGIMSSTSNTVEVMLIDLINLFKSYTVDMVNFNIIYLLDLKPETLIRFINKAFIHKEIQVNDYIHMSYDDHALPTSNILAKDFLAIRDQLAVYGGLMLFDTLKMYSEIHHILANLDIKDRFSIYDVTEDILSSILISDRVLFHEQVKIYASLIAKDNLTFEEYLRMLSTLRISGDFNLYDVGDFISSNGIIEDTLFFKSIYDYYVTYHLDTHFSLRDYLVMVINIMIKCKGIFFNDTGHVISKNILSDILILDDKLNLDASLYIKDEFKLEDIYNMITRCFLDDDMSYYDVGASFSKTIITKVKFFIESAYISYSTLYVNDEGISFNDYFTKVIRTMMEEVFTMNNIIRVLTSSMYLEDDPLTFRDKMVTTINLIFTGGLEYKDRILLMSSTKFNDLLRFYDTNDEIHSTIGFFDSLKLKQTYRISYN